MKLVIAVYTSTKVTAQIWWLLSHAYEIGHWRIFFHQSNRADLAATISCRGSQSLHYILPPRSQRRFGGYYLLHTKLVIGVYTTYKTTAQHWRLLSFAYEIGYCDIFFHQSNCADLAATNPAAYKVGHSSIYFQSSCADLAATIPCIWNPSL